MEDLRLGSSQSDWVSAGSFLTPHSGSVKIFLFIFCLCKKVSVQASDVFSVSPGCVIFIININVTASASNAVCIETNLCHLKGGHCSQRRRSCFMLTHKQNCPALSCPVMSCPAMSQTAPEVPPPPKVCQIT